MKIAINAFGEEVNVSDDVLTKMVDGIAYLLNAQEIAEIAASELAFINKLPERVSSKIMEKRRMEYPAPQAGSDMFWHFLDWMKLNKVADYNSLSTTITSWYDACKQVKINNPK